MTWVPALALCLLGVLGGDDPVPVAIEAALAVPDDPIQSGVPLLLDAIVLHQTALPGTVRCVADVGDANGDGLADLAVGLGPGSAGPTLAVLDGGSGAPLWGAQPGAGSFRSLRGLALDGGRLAAGTSSARGRVELRRVTDGSVLWGRQLAGRASATPANVSAVCFSDDLDGDGVRDLLVAGGARILAVELLSGADGHTLWRHPVGDVVADVVPAADHDGDGLPDVFAVGGSLTPSARLLSGASGQLLWQQPLDGPGSVGLQLDDIDDDGRPDFAVGQLNQPGACLLALSGADGARLWEAPYVTHGVTSLALLDDILGLGVHDIAVGSFDNAVNAVLSRLGLLAWRREVSQINGGAMFSVAVTSDLEGSGFRDVIGSSLDHRAYVDGGFDGQFMARHLGSGKTTAVGALADRTADGRSEMIVAGAGFVAVLDGASGTGAGPVLEVEPAEHIADTIRVVMWSYPTTDLVLWGALGAGSLSIPGVQGVFLLDLRTLVPVFGGPTPGVGAVALELGPLDRSAIGLQIHLQVLAQYDEGIAILSNAVSFAVVP